MKRNPLVRSPLVASLRLSSVILAGTLGACSGDRPVFPSLHVADSGASDTQSSVDSGTASMTTEGDSTLTDPTDGSDDTSTGVNQSSAVGSDESSGTDTEDSVPDTHGTGENTAGDAGNGTGSANQTSSAQPDAGIGNGRDDASSPNPDTDIPTIAAFVSSEQALPGGGGTVTLSWDIDGADQVKIEPDVGIVSGDLIQVDVDQRTTFTLTATNEGGSASESLTVDVSAAGTREWILQYGSRDDEGDSVSAFVADRDGALFVVGSTTGLFSDDTVSSDDSYDAVIAKLDESGEPTWIRQLGNESGDQDLATAVALDGEDNVIVGGETGGVVDEGSHVDASRNGMVAKYTNEGELLWVRQLGSQEAESVGNLGTRGYGVAADSSNSVYLVGETHRILDASVGAKLGTEPDLFIAKYNSEGLLIWKRQLNSTNSGTDKAYDVAVDSSDRIYVSGSTSSTFAPEHEGAGADDAFLAQYDINGNRIWLRQFGTSDYDAANSVATDRAGSIYTSGHFAMSGNYVTEQTRPFLAKYTSEGEQVWLKELVTLHSKSDVASSVAVDPGGSIYIAGLTQGAVGHNTPTSLVDAQDTFVAKYNADGDLIWVQQVQAEGAQYGGALAVSSQGYVFLGGTIYGTVGENVTDGSNTGADMFIARYR